MELSAVVDGLRRLKEPCIVNIYSDSAYVVNAVVQDWLTKWQRNGWRNASKEPVKNREIWEMLIVQMRKHECTFIKVAGHSDNEYNNCCDALCNRIMDEYEGKGDGRNFEIVSKIPTV